MAFDDQVQNLTQNPRSSGDTSYLQAFINLDLFIPVNINITTLFDKAINIFFFPVCDKYIYIYMY